MSEHALVSRPSPEQLAAFSKLSFEERFEWLVGMLALCHELTPPELRARWHALKRQPKNALR